MIYPPPKVEDGNSLDWDSRGSQKQLAIRARNIALPREFTFWFERNGRRSCRVVRQRGLVVTVDFCGS